MGRPSARFLHVERPTHPLPPGLKSYRVPNELVLVVLVLEHRLTDLAGVGTAWPAVRLRAHGTVEGVAFTSLNRASMNSPVFRRSSPITSSDLWGGRERDCEDEGGV